MQAVMLGSSSSLYVMLPCVIFSVSIALAFATGTSYGTFGVILALVNVCTNLLLGFGAAILGLHIVASMT